MPAPTLRSIAAILGFSRTTISDALAGDPRVNRFTAERIRSACQELGYSRHPLASALMSQLRRSHGQEFRGFVAAVDFDTTDRPETFKAYRSAMTTGAMARAKELGFKLEIFSVGPSEHAASDLNATLAKKGVRGVLVLPTWNDPDLSSIDWSRFAGVYTDYFTENPSLHSVCPDHYRGMVVVLRRLRQLGYRRPGLFVNQHLNERIQYRWEGALLAHSEQLGFESILPSLKFGHSPQGAFSSWMRKYEPDVVLGHYHPEIFHRRRHSPPFVCLNRAGCPPGCAGLDLQPQLIGHRAIELLAPHLVRNELGIPSDPSTTTVDPIWHNGASLPDSVRKRSASTLRHRLVVSTG